MRQDETDPRLLAVGRFQVARPTLKMRLSLNSTHDTSHTFRVNHKIHPVRAVARIQSPAQSAF